MNLLFNFYFFYFFNFNFFYFFSELAPAIKSVFEQGKEEEVIKNLTLFIKEREREIEKICQNNYQVK